MTAWNVAGRTAGSGVSIANLTLNLKHEPNLNPEPLTHAGPSDWDANGTSKLTLNADLAVMSSES